MMEMIFKIMWKSPDTIFCLSFYIKLCLECSATILQTTIMLQECLYPMESLYIKCQVPRVSYDVNTPQRKCFCTKGQLCNCVIV